MGNLCDDRTPVFIGHAFYIPAYWQTNLARRREKAVKNV